MSQFCPLCGKNKPEKALFCANCKNKIEKEYEVNVPQEAENAVVERDSNEQSETMPAIVSTPKKRKRSIVAVLLVLAVCLVIAFFYYGQLVRRSNLDKSKWELAAKEHTINAYLVYMQDFPKGEYYDLAKKNLMDLKNLEAENWEKLKVSENTAELRDFLAQFPESPYNYLVKRQLDSLTWMATLNDNTAESYSKYILLSQGGEFSGDYLSEAQKRYEMLLQSYSIIQNDLDSVKLVVNGFFTALSSINANEIVKYLSSRVFQFFDSDGGTSEKIVGDLLISASKTENPSIKFVPNTDALAYEKTLIEHFKVNVPVQKTIVEKDGQEKNVSGYIAHIEMDNDFRIITVSESKPFVDAP